MEVLDLNRFYLIYGGVAWPGVRPGYVSVLGRDRANAPGLNEPSIFALAEFESHDYLELLRKAAEFEKAYGCEKWLCSDLSDSAGMDALKTLNHELQTKMPRDDRQEKLILKAAPWALAPDCFSVWANIAKKKLTPGEKVLQFGNQSGIPSLLLQIKPEDIYKSTPRDYPAVACVGMVLSALISERKHFQDDLKKHRQADMESYV